MFGYVSTAPKKLSDGENGLYQTFMCGLCMSTKAQFRNMARLSVNFDINFFNVLFHSFLGMDVTVENKKCFSHPFVKRPILKVTPVTDKLAVANVLLIYLKLCDDVIDGGSLKKKAVMKAFGKDYLTAKRLWPEMDEMLGEKYEELRVLEKSECDSLDKVCHPFAELSERFCRITLGEDTNDNIAALCYNVGKWIYLIDALDDVKQDLRKGCYNAFVAYYKLKDYTEVAEHGEEINFLMYAVLNRITQCYNDLNLGKYRCLLDNVIYESMREKTKKILDDYGVSKTVRR